jgi:hypothetical protein
LKLYALGCITGALIAGRNAKTNPDSKLSGGIAGSGTLIGYHIFKNPQWFKFGINPFVLLPLFFLYGAFYNEPGALGGLGFGYLAFLFGFF